MNTAIDSTAETLLPATQAAQNVLEAQIHLHCDNFRRIEHSALIEASLCGEKLLQLKPLIPHGQFEDHVNRVFNINRNRSSQWMRLAKEFPAESLTNTPTLNLPSYTAALELLDSRNDTPEVKTIKEEIRQQILVDGETYSVMEIRALKAQAQQMENKAQDDIDSAYQYTTNLEAELSAKDADIQSLQADIAKLRKNTGADMQAQIIVMEDQLEALKKQHKAKKKQLASLDVDLFEKQHNQHEEKEFNEHLTELALKIEKELETITKSMRSLRTKYFDRQLDKKNHALVQIIAEQLLKSAIDLYDIADLEPSRVESILSNYLNNYTYKRQPPLL